VWEESKAEHHALRDILMARTVEIRLTNRIPFEQAGWHRRRNACKEGHEL